MTALELTSRLVSFPSVSSTSNQEITQYLANLLDGWKFQLELIEYRDANQILKQCLIARKGTGSGGLAYFGHTDVVPATIWNGPGEAFEPSIKDGRLYGRGSCDMKGSIACWLTALEDRQHAHLKHPIYVVLTSDEEVGYVGATHVAKKSVLFQEMVEQGVVGIVGEPTHLEVVHAHKGIYAFKAISTGQAAHSSSSQGVSANWAMIPFLAEMKSIYDETSINAKWRNEQFDPPGISWNIVFNDAMTASNVKAEKCLCQVLFRPMPGQSPEELVERARIAAINAGLEFKVRSEFPPLWVDPASPHIKELLMLCEREQTRTVCYGTDGAAFSAIGRLAVIGPGQIEQAHTVHEWISLEQLEKGTQVFGRVLDHYAFN